MTGVVSPWFVLGVPEDAPLPIVRAAWRRAIREFHPDAHGNGDVDRYRVAEAAWHELREVFATRDDTVAATTGPRADDWLTDRPSPVHPSGEQQVPVAAPDPDWWEATSVTPDNSGSGLSIDALTQGAPDTFLTAESSVPPPRLSADRTRAAVAVAAGAVAFALVGSLLVVPLVATAWAVAHRRGLGLTVPTAAAVGAGCAALGGLVATAAAAAAGFAPRLFGSTSALGATATAGVAAVAAAAAVSAWRFDTRSRER